MKQDLRNKENINIMIFAERLLARWYYFVISAVLFISLGVFIIKYVEPVYKVKASVIVKEKDKNISSENFFAGIEAFSFFRNIDNEMGILSSSQLVYKTLSELHFEVSYFRKRWLQSREIYHAPFKIVLDTAAPQVIGIPVYISKIKPGEYVVEASASNADVQHIGSQVGEYIYQGEVNIQDTIKAGQLYSSKYLSFTLLEDNAITEEAGERLYFTINNLTVLTNDYIERLTLNTSAVGSSIIDITLKGSLIQKEKDFLNRLCRNDIQWGLTQKNEIATNTIAFIDNQINDFSDSLTTTEDKLEKFRVGDNMVDLDFQAKNSYELLKQLEEENVALKVKHKYYTYLQSYINSNKALDKLVAPSTIGIDDPLLNNLISELNVLNSEKAALSFGVRSKSPSYNMVELKIDNSKKTLAENVKSIIMASEIALKENERRMRTTSGMLDRLPKNERQLLSIQRKFNHNDLMYNFLMEKRAAASIARASSVADNKVLDYATLVYNDPVFPNKPLVMALALLLGMVFPAGFIIAGELFRNKIRSKEEVYKYSGMELIGLLPHVRKGTGSDQFTDDAVFREYIGILRSNLANIPANGSKVIGITSVGRREGKSFISINLAIAFARCGKKVVLLETDFRNPVLARLFNSQNKGVLNNYLEQSKEVEDIIYTSPYPGLDFIPAAPADGKQDVLLGSGEIGNLIKSLRSRYEIVITDSTAAGYFSDYYSIAPLADINLFIVRSNYTKFSEAEKLDEIRINSCFGNCYVVLNDYLLPRDVAKAFGNAR